MDVDESRGHVLVLYIKLFSLSAGSRDEHEILFSVTVRVLLFGPIQGTIFWFSVTVTLVFFGQNQPYLFVHKDGRHYSESTNLRTVRLFA